MAVIHGKGKPKGRVPEGIDTFKITKIEGTPRANVTKVKVTFANRNGEDFYNNYDLENTGGWAAFYYLAQACGYDLDDEGVEFDLSDLDGCFVELDIIHNEVPAKDKETKEVIPGKFATFVNIKWVVGPGTPFGLEADEDTDDEDTGNTWE